MPPLVSKKPRSCIDFVPFIADKPYCRADQQDVYGVATGETVRIPCDVFGDPSETMKFEWVFNTSTEWYPKQPESVFGVTSPERGWTRAYIQHTPKVIQTWAKFVSIFKLSGNKSW